MMFLILPAAVVVSFFGPIRGGNMMYNLCRFWADVVLFFWGMPHKNYFDYPKAKGRGVVFVFNHQSYIDIPFIMKTFRKEPIRILGKAELMKVPLFGIIYSKAVIPVYRNSAADRAKSLTLMKEYLSQNISVLIAPEGTFNTTGNPLKEFYDGAFRIAIDTNTNIQPVIFLDSFDRMHYDSIFSITPGKSRAHFLQEISSQNETVMSLKAKTYQMMEEALIAHKASWIKNLPAK